MRRHHPGLSLVTPLVATVVTVLAVAGCGDGSSPSSDTGSPDGSPRTQFVQARGCVKDAGFRAIGGPKGPGDEDAPAFELIVSGGDRESAFVAIYGSADEASRLLPHVEANVTESKKEGASVSVEPHGSVSVVWTQTPPAEDFRGAVLGCLP